jgi:PAS domain S-box-containing protein
MTEERNHSGTTGTLRQRAEEAFLTKPAVTGENITAQTPEEMQRVLHELQVHQIELEIQNEELRRVQAELEASRERYFDLYDLAPVGYMTLSGQDLIMEANLAAASQLCMPRNALVRQPLSRFILGEDQDIYYRHCKELVATGEPHTCEVRMTRGDADPFWVRLEAATGQDSQGEPLCRVVMSDIQQHREMEEHLQDSEMQYRTLFEAIADAVFLIHQETGRILDVNPAATCMYGFNREEFQQMTSMDVSAEPEETARATRDPVAFIPIRYHRHKNGTVFPVELTASTFELRGENTIIAAARNISERMRAENELQESEQKYRSLVAVLPGILYSYSNQRAGVFYSPQVESVLGYTADHLHNHPTLWHDSIHPDDLPEVDRKIQESAKKQNIEIEYRIRDAKGQWRWFLDRSARIVSSENNDEIIIEGLAVDITEQKRAEDALRKSEKSLRLSEQQLILAQRLGHTGSWIYNPATDKIWGSAEGLRIFGFSSTAGEWPIEDIECCIPERERIHERLVSLIAGETPYDLEYEINPADGSPLRTVHSIALLEKDAQGNPRKVIGFIQDITERIQTEKENAILQERLHNAEKMEMMGKLAGRVAHDLNNVLGVLVGYSELLAERIPKGNPLGEYAANIMKSSEKAATIVEDLLTLTRRGVRVMEVVNCNKIVVNLLKTPEMEKLIAYHPHVIFKTDFAGDLLNVTGSPVHIEKSILNLLSNAAEAIADRGEVTIKTENRYLDRAVNGYQTVKEGEYVLLTVSDTGKGIPATELQKIFEPFYTKKNMGRSGTGLGLAIVWGTVQDHNGYVDVQTSEGKGTIFTIYFSATRRTVEKEAEKTPVEQYLGHGDSLLVVDDVQEQREVAYTLLTQLNYTVNTVSSGEEAVEYLNKNKADLLVLDMIMDPGIDGLDTYKQVLKINPQQKAIIVSGFSETDRSKEAQKLGAGAYVKKPYLKEKIGMAIRDELARK